MKYINVCGNVSLFLSDGAGEGTRAGLHPYRLDTFDCIQDGQICGCCSVT